MTETCNRPDPSADDGAALKSALRRLAKSVVIITVRHAGQRHAMAATAVDALSMDPPSLLACVNRSASIHAAMSAGSHFAINILGGDHEPVSLHCSGPNKGEARFDVGAWDDSGPVPVLADAQATIVCRADRTFDYGTHTIFIGIAEAVGVHGEVNPLIYIDGQYRTLPPG